MGIHACLVARNGVWSFDMDQARHPTFCQRGTGRNAAPAQRPFRSYLGFAAAGGPKLSRCKNRGAFLASWA